MVLTHKDLVGKARLWLINSKRCNPVFCEKGSQGCTEMPDAIGWTCDDCIVIECKTSKSDLLANNNKELKLGNKRYFLISQELYKEAGHLIPEGYGIITVNETHRVSQERFKDSNVFVSCHRSEIRYLRSRILAIQQYGI